MTPNSSTYQKAIFLPLIVVSLVLAAWPEPAAAQRAITVNGHWLSAEQARAADQTAGFVLPDGDYYCDPMSGLWGLIGQTPAGQIHPSYCPLPAGLTTPGGGYVERGPFGSSGSDGECSYYLDPETGASVMTGNC